MYSSQSTLRPLGLHSVGTQTFHGAFAKNTFAKLQIISNLATFLVNKIQKYAIFFLFTKNWKNRDAVPNSKNTPSQQSQTDR